MVWMRASATSDIQKLYGRIPLLSRGSYSLTIQNNYPRWYFKGEKRLYLKTVNRLGSSNTPIAIIYLLTGVLFIFYASCLYTPAKQSVL